METTEEIEEPELIDGLAVGQIWRRRLTNLRYRVAGEFRGLWYLIFKKGAPPLELSAETIKREFELVRDHHGRAIEDEGDVEYEVL